MVGAPLPDDELAADPSMTTTRAIMIDAPQAAAGSLPDGGTWELLEIRARAGREPARGDAPVIVSRASASTG